VTPIKAAKRMRGAAMEATTHIQARIILHPRIKVVSLVGAQPIYCASLVENKIVVGVHGIITEVLEAIHTPPFSTPKEVLEASIRGNQSALEHQHHKKQPLPLGKQKLQFDSLLQELKKC
jgi:hypothetical protein